MVRKRPLGPGRPRKVETKLSHWLDSSNMTRYELAKRLGVARGHVDKICNGERRPSLELAVAIDKFTAGAVPVTYWTSVPTHSRD